MTEVEVEILVHLHEVCVVVVDIGVVVELVDRDVVDC